VTGAQGFTYDTHTRVQRSDVGGQPTLAKQLRVIVVLLAIGALAMALLGVVSVEGGVRFALIVLVAYAAVVVVARVLAPFGRLARAPRRRRLRRRSSEVAGPAFVERAARELELASGSAVRFEQLRGRLREIAERRLAGRGLRFESDGARAVLGDEAWRLLERPLERDKFASGPSPAELDRLLAALERV
jgi:hypothetical protein